MLFYKKISLNPSRMMTDVRDIRNASLEIIIELDDEEFPRYVFLFLCNIVNITQGPSVKLKSLSSTK